MTSNQPSERMISGDDYSRFVLDCIRNGTMVIEKAWREDRTQGLRASHLMALVSQVLEHSKRFVLNPSTRGEIEQSLGKAWDDFQKCIAPECLRDLDEDGIAHSVQAPPGKEEFIRFVMQNLDQYMDIEPSRTSGNTLENTVSRRVACITSQIRSL